MVADETKKEGTDYSETKIAGTLRSEYSDLLFCPLCGSKEFDTFEGTAAICAAVYCCKCPYGVEDSEMSLKEIIDWHNRRAI